MIIYALTYTVFLLLSIKYQKLRYTVLSLLNGFFFTYLLSKIVYLLPWDNFILTGLLLLLGTIFANFFENYFFSSSHSSSYTYCTYEVFILFIAIIPIIHVSETIFMCGISLYICISYIFPEKVGRYALFTSVISSILGFFVGITIFL